MRLFSCPAFFSLPGQNSRPICSVQLWPNVKSIWFRMCPHGVRLTHTDLVCSCGRNSPESTFFPLKYDDDSTSIYCAVFSCPSDALILSLGRSVTTSLHGAQQFSVNNTCQPRLVCGGLSCCLALRCSCHPDKSSRQNLCSRGKHLEIQFSSLTHWPASDWREHHSKPSWAGSTQCSISAV